MHVLNLSYLEACEMLTGEPPPRGNARPISAEAMAERERRRYESEKRQRERDQNEVRRRKSKAETATEIWAQVVGVDGTLAEQYLIKRGIPRPSSGWPETIGFHRGLEWELGSEWNDDRKVKAGPVFPCLVARVEDNSGATIAVWRIFLDPASCGKAPVEKPKLGFGPAAGGAIRLGGVATKIGVAEGLESAFGAWWLTGMKFPVWSATSTSGLINLELPLEVETVVIFPDGDRPIKLKDHEYVASEPAGRRATRLLSERLSPIGVHCVAAAEPSAGLDYLNIWQRASGHVEA